MSRREPGRFSNAPTVKGAPRPDISYYEGGSLKKIIELKFKGDGETQMQRRGDYNKILESNGLNPDSDLINLNVDSQCQIPTS